MRLLFVGTEAEYLSSLLDREDGSPFSLFFCSALPESSGAYDAIVMPALRLLSLPPAPRAIPVIASGPRSMIEDCFEYGCADYLLEPWTEAELHARVLARTAPRLELEQGHIHAMSGRITGPLGTARLCDASYRVLVLLHLNRGRTVPRQAIASCVCQDSRMAPPGSRSIDMRMARLRTTLRTVGAFESARSIQGHRGCYSFIA